jgi:hypothetical protein
LLFFVLSLAGLARVLFFDFGHFDLAAFVKTADRTDLVRQDGGPAVFADAGRFAFRFEIVGVIGARSGMGAPLFWYWHFLLLKTHS